MSIATLVTFIVYLAVVLAVWRQRGRNDPLYEIVPGTAGCSAAGDRTAGRLRRRRGVKNTRRAEYGADGGGRRLVAG